MQGSLDAPPIVMRGARWRGYLFLAFALGYLAQILCAVALGVIPGDPKPNRFGPPPGVRAPATVAETFR